MRVNWILGADRNNACSRMHGYLVYEHLQRAGVPCRLLGTPPFPFRDAPWPAELHGRIARLVEGEIVVLEKLAGPNAEALCEALRGRATVIYAQGDYAAANPLPLRCDVIVSSAAWMADWYRDRGAERSEFIADPAEFWGVPAEITGQARRPGKVRLCWMGHRANWKTLGALRELLRDPELRDFELVAIANHPEADVPWSFDTLVRTVAECDVGVVTTRPPPVSLGKSSNRVVQFMAAGKPVVAGTTVPSYREVLRSGWNGFLCETPEEWRDALVALRDPKLRRDFAARGYDTVFPRYQAERISAEWLALFESLPRPARRHLPRVREARLASAAEVEARAAYAREALRLNLGLRLPLQEAARALVLAPAAPGSAARLVRSIARPGAARLLERLPERRRIQLLLHR